MLHFMDFSLLIYNSTFAAIVLKHPSDVVIELLSTSGCVFWSVFQLYLEVVRIVIFCKLH